MYYRRQIVQIASFDHLVIAVLLFKTDFLN